MCSFRNSGAHHAVQVLFGGIEGALQASEEILGLAAVVGRITAHVHVERDVAVFRPGVDREVGLGQHDATGHATVFAEAVEQATDRSQAGSFNLLDARGAISVTERAAYIGRIRNLARAVAQSYYESRERLGFPMAPREWVEQMPKKAA